MRMTKIVATLGPASQDVETMKELIEAGMDAARINFSHGDYESHSVIINNLKQARKELNRPIPLILDTKGPEIRTGKMKNNESVELVAGQDFTLTTEDVLGTKDMVSVSYHNFMKDIDVGARIMIDDGLIELYAMKITDRDVVCKVLNGGKISSNKGINLPSAVVHLPTLTEKDIEDLKFGIKMGFDYVAASFIRTENDVLEIRKVLKDNGGSHIRIISKIENREGLDNVEKIIKVSDGLMVARGDLGIEIPPEEVPVAQKNMISLANLMGKTVITATQMLESMTTNPRPTRAEASDVANAVFDGSDAVMLSGETAKGSYPVDSVRMMAKIAVKAETDKIHYKNTFKKGQSYDFHVHEHDPIGITNAISYSTCTTAYELGAKCIVTVTNSGFTARNVSKFRPECPILGISIKETVWRQLNLIWGCFPEILEIKADEEQDLYKSETVFKVADVMAKKSGLAKDGDPIVVVAGLPVGVAGTTNMLRAQMVGNELVRRTEL